MAPRKRNSVACAKCGLTITEPKTAQAIREKLRALGWKFTYTAGSKHVTGHCGKCCTECSFYRPARFTGDLKDMESPYMEQ